MKTKKNTRTNVTTAESPEKKIGAVMVVGAGIAGIQASLDLAASGLKVYLVEKSPSIGGTMAQLDKTFPTNDCSMCILSPKLVECGRHLNIESIMMGEILGVAGTPGNFSVRVNRRARYIDLAKCTGCGDCAKACPVEFEDDFNAGLGKRKAVFRQFPQAYPNAFAIDKRERAVCTQGCPGGINIQGFVALIGAGKFKEALGVIRESIAFPSVCGRVCHHPCELVCKRNEFDKPLNVMALKRFVSDTCGDEELHLPQKEEAKPQKVSIIGAGPAGLSAAFELAKKGYPVDVFESLPEPGGMLAVGIPDYRLPRKVLQKDIDRIRKMGVAIHVNKKLGKDISVEGLKNQGYKAVLLAIGAHAALKLGIKGEDLNGVLDSVQFLRDVNLGNKMDLGQNVVVVGGGNSAIDAARVAKRLNNPDVTLLYRRTRKEMPALPHEVNEALLEGVNIHYLAAPIGAKGENGKLTSVLCQKMKLGNPDASGRRSPVPIPGSEFEIKVDTLISAISQKIEADPGMGAKLNKWGAIETEKDSTRTSLDGVFACGDAVLGPSTVIDSIATGKNAAIDIHAFLSNTPAEKKKPLSNQFDKKPFSLFYDPKDRAEIPQILANQRINNFNEVDQVFSAEVAVAEAQRCLACGLCCECMECVKACKPGAINHRMQDQVQKIQVGAIILALGFCEFPAEKKFSYGYSRSKNILSSIEFERMLSASGPFGGHIVRPSDHKTPRKIAFLQCVGSRDQKCKNEFCSSVCCMYSIKEAVIAREHQKEVEPTIFYMDMRAHGKDFDKYYERAKNEYGVTFKKARASKVEETPTGKIAVQFEGEDGMLGLEEFDLAVLSVGLTPSDDYRVLGERLHVDLNEFGFLKTLPFSPLDASSPGIFLCGPASGPKDIPETVMQASGAAARAASLLSAARHTLTKAKEYPLEMDVSYRGPRIGVFVCHCGINIGGVVNVPSVTEYARTLPNVVYAEENLYTCSQDTQEKIKEIIKAKELNRVVVASCSPRTHEPLFQETVREAGLNPYLFEMANIRDQCSWVHMQEKERATEKARDLVCMAVARVRGARPIKPVLMDVTQKALVLGGGLAGMTCALSIANQGFEVFLVEKESKLGGNLLKLDKNLEGQNVIDHLQALTDEVQDHPLINVFKNSNLANVEGFVGNFESLIKTQTGKQAKETKVKHGVAVIAVGGFESKPEEYSFGKSKNIITQQDLELKLAGRKFKSPGTVVMIQCVGSREQGHMYCSRVCCGNAVKNAIRLKEMDPQTDIYILYRDIRTYGLMEKYYTKARESGVIFVRYDLAAKPQVNVRGNSVNVTVHDTLLGTNIEIPADLLVLSSRVDPNPDNETIAKFFKVPLNYEKFFLEAHAKLRPVDFATDGVFVCGIAHYPKSMAETIAQAEAASARAATVLSKNKIAGEGKISYVRTERCAGCGACEKVCAYNAITLDAEKRIAVVNEAICKGCGACAATCRSAAIDLKGVRDDQILSVLNEIF